jgi:hypothetical protein
LGVEQVKVMADHDLGVFAATGTAGDAALADGEPVTRARAPRIDLGVDQASSLASAESDQLASDIAAIERAAAALRKAEPALESWSNPPAQASRKPRPVWLLIGVLWVSTALVTVGAAVAIAVLVG